MKTPNAPAPLRGLLVTLAAVLACSDDPSGSSNASAGGKGGPAGASAAGTAGAPTAGKAGASGGGSAGSRSIAGSSGSPGQGGNAGAPPSGGAAGSPPLAGSAGSLQAGSAGSAKGGSAGFPAAGSGGAGAAPYPTDENPTPIIPTTCPSANGEWGCCGPDGNAYYAPYGGLEVKKIECAPFGCGWSEAARGYRCGASGDEPRGLIARMCSNPPFPSGCAYADCGPDMPCDPAIFGAGSRCVGSRCIRCESDAECAVGWTCNEYGSCSKKLCETDADCNFDPAKPACDPELYRCVECDKDFHCSGVGKDGCFVGTCGCKTDAACAASPRGTSCNEIELHCGCKSAADCPNPNAPFCVKGVCSGCAKNSDCVASPGRPYCVTDDGVSACVACRKDTDCGGDKPFCIGGSCAPGCTSSYECAGAFPVCQFAEDGTGSCGPAPECAKDDPHELGDDNPLTATMVLAPASPVTGSICGLPGERDFYPFTLADGEDAILAVASSDPTVFVGITDGQGLLLGLSFHAPHTLHVRALAAGTYYAVVGMGVDDGNATPVSYTLERSGGKAPCTSDAFCALTTPTEIFRGRCDLVVGACRFLDGKGTLPADAPCDDDADCASGFCAGYAFAGQPGKRSRCSAPCDGDTPLGPQPTSSLCSKAGLPTWVCTEGEAPNRCVPKCESDGDCPVTDYTDAPEPGKPWRHLVCASTGHCEQPE